MQEVPLAGITSTPTASFQVGGHTTTLRYPDDFVASSEQLRPEEKFDGRDAMVRQMDADCARARLVLAR